MLTLGVDLSAGPTNTAVARIEWTARSATLTYLRTWFRDDALLDILEKERWVGVDVPFGWPLEFVEALTEWPGQTDWPDTERVDLRYRRTDLFVREHFRSPLSVSSDRIGVTAMRWARLLTLLSKRRGGRPIERDGSDGFFEVYPAAALDAWSSASPEVELPSSGYKGWPEKQKAVRVRLLESLFRAAPWLSVTREQRDVLTNSDDALDAVICALIARAAAKGETYPPGDEEIPATLEGWIHVPRAPLSSLL